MPRGLQCALVLSAFLAACAGSDGHPPVADEIPNDNAGGSDGDPTGPTMGTSGKGNTPSTDALYDGGFIAIPQVSDIALDEPRGVLYVSTTDGGLALVDLATGKISSQPVGEGPLTGMDLSPDGNLLAIGEYSTDQEAKEFWVHVLDLEAQTIHQVRIPIEPMALVDGSQSVAFTGNGSLLVSASWEAFGYSPIYLVDLADDSSVKFRTGWSDAMFQRSGDGSVVDFIEPAHGEGGISQVNVASQEVIYGEIGAPLRDLSVNADGSKIGLPLNGTFALRGPGDDAFSAIGNVSEEKRDAMASVFSPVRDSVYVAWSKGDAEGGLVTRYSADAALEPEGVIQASVPLATKRASGYVPARMKISSDGTLLFLTVEKGINVYALEP